ncbi:hypothetical protein UFOVP84_49 [uncultured Caudovirales phage]|uniref:GIY-YIG domain-containing protein n=1 Tax=uncultured Caudovirales phage TaxID=2100421 RepID=A0A6J5L576_9CAUD|nr:hypothetical protein UFOVP84_49 [uncultured Caudovirales phage]
MTSKDIYTHDKTRKYDETEKYYVYFLCDPSKPGKNLGDYYLPYEPFYCGKGTLSRINSKKNKAVNDKITSMINKGVEVEYIQIGAFNEETAFDLEKYFVQYFGRRDTMDYGSLLNLRDGGDGGRNPSLETREKLRASHLGQLPNIGSFKKGQIPWNKGLKMSEECNKKNSESIKKTYENGRTIWNAGKSYRLGSKSSNSKSVIIDGTLYNSIIEASDNTGLSLYLIKKRYLKEEK